MEYETPANPWVPQNLMNIPPSTAPYPTWRQCREQSPMCTFRFAFLEGPKISEFLRILGITGILRITGIHGFSGFRKAPGILAIPDIFGIS